MYGKFKVKVKYTKQLEDGTFKRVTEAFLLDAMTFSDAETRIYEQMGNLIRGEFLVTSISKESIQEIIHDEGFETWFKGNVKFFSSTDDGSKAKVVSHTVLCQSENVELASKSIKQFYETVGISVEVNSCGKSDVLEYFIIDPDSKEEKDFCVKQIQQIRIQGDKWFNVSEKLPDIDEPLLVIDRYGYYSVCGFNKKWYPKLEGTHTNFDSDSITHWTELPTSPIELES